MINIWEIALDKPLYSTFDYLAESLHINTPLYARVIVPFGKKQMIGLLIKKKKDTKIEKNKLKKIYKVLDNKTLLNDDIIKLCSFAANYYKQPLGQMLFLALPQYIQQYQKEKPINEQLKTIALNQSIVTKQNQLTLTQEQNKAIEQITLSLNQFKIFLLDGITGSGKTEVFLQVIQTVLQNHQQILYLVPEINLTPQTISRITERFNAKIAVLHSNLSAKKRAMQWMAAKQEHAQIIIGTRSSVFVPAKLGLIIVDEEHDLSFKQQNQIRYCAKNLAIVRAKNNNIPIILASATPAFESLVNIKEKNYTHLTLRTNPNNTNTPIIDVIDLKKEKLQHGLSIAAINLIKKTLNKKEQILLFINRRGYSPCLMCSECGWFYRCERCEKLMTYHKKSKKITCHHCDKTFVYQAQCKHCNSEKLLPIGVGTQRLEDYLTTVFPNTPILRVDKDSTQKKDSLNTMLNQINTGEALILIGTQMLAKGHHFKNLSSVIITDIDIGLHSNDLFATEHLAQLLTQVFGRAGRFKTQGQILLQTFYPDHPLLQCIIKQNYNEYAQFALNERKIAKLPPYRSIALLTAKSHQQQQVFAFLSDVKRTINDESILGPVAANHQKKQGFFHAYLLIQHNNRQALHTLLNKIINMISQIKQHRVHWQLNVDPKEIL